MNNFKFIEHTADIGIEVSADTLEDLFTTSAEALCEISLKRFQLNNNFITEHFTITRTTLEELLVEFLSEINFNIVTRKKVLIKVEDIFIVQVHNGFELMTKLSFNKFSFNEHFIQQEIKAITYHQLKIENTGKGFQTKIIFDT